MVDAAAQSGHGSTPRSTLRRLIAALPWPPTYAGRLTIACLAGNAVPPAIVLVLFLSGAGDSVPGAAMVVAAFATAWALGGIVTWIAMRAALEPVVRSAQVLQRYQAEHVVPDLPKDYPLEAGALMREVHHTIISIERAHAELRRRAETDPLTGVMNRRSFFGRGGEELSRARRSGEPLALVIFDIDHFKVINDSHGHAAGDAVLRIITGAVGRQLRAYDALARLGGEEFAVLLPGARFEDAVGVAERLRAEISSLPIPALEGTEVTASFGVSVLVHGDVTVEDVLNRADLALYDAKRGGRNRVVWRVSSEPPTRLEKPAPPARAAAATAAVWEVD